MQPIPGYETTEVVYESAKTITYRGVNVADQKPIILKMLKAEHPSLNDIAKLKHEYELTKNLDIDNVIKPFGLETYGHGVVLLLEDFGGHSLKQLIDGNHPFDLKAMLEIAIKLAETIGLLHRDNIIHKDIKPHNIIVNPTTGTVKIADFGISSRLTRETQEINHPNLLEGTLAYMSPEQTGRMNQAMDYRTDFYSLGITLYELFTGQVPFQSSDALELVHAHIAKQPLPPQQINPTVPPVLGQIILKLMAKTAEERYQSAYGLQVDLSTCLSQLENSGKAEDFMLGQHDFSDKFQISQKLYGRDEEMATMVTAIEQVGHGASELLLVTGYSGIGKSALVNEIHRLMAQRQQGGYFIAGKFDQFQRNVPYSTFIQAFQDLVRQILTESEAEIAIWRERLLAALEPNGQVITDVIAELELIIGPQPVVPSLGPTETQNRFNLVWQKFIGTFTSEKHPLVIFLDDLQWADAASLHLIERLVTDPDYHHLLLVGAYRDNEVGSSHPLHLTLQQIESKQVNINRIALEPLQTEDLSQLMADTLHQSPQAVEPLATLTYEKTNGNPFFVLEFLKTLYQEKLLTFVLPQTSSIADVNGRSGWQWDLLQIQAMEITDNVVDLMAGKLQKLAPQTQTVLQLAACIGNTFDLQTIATVYEKSPVETVADLHEAIQQGLILGVSDLELTTIGVDLDAGNDSSPDSQPNSLTYKFLHDRVQQVAYGLIEAEEKQVVHQKIGHLLLAQIGDNQDALEDKIFDVVNHLTLGAGLLKTQSEKSELAKLSLLAGHKAKVATAYEAALTYLKIGMDHLSADSWSSQYDLTLNLHLERAEVEYLVGQFELAESLCDVMLENVNTDQDRNNIYNLKIDLYTSLSKYEECLQIGREAARVLGLHLPESPNQFHLIREVLKARWYMRGKKVEELIDLPPMSDPQQLAIMTLLMNLSSAAFLSDELFAVLMSLKMVNISLRHGTSSVTPFCYIAYANVNLGLGNFEYADQFGQLALKLNQRLKNSEIEYIINYIFGASINHWNRHYKTGVEYFMGSYQDALEGGALTWADYSLGTVTLHSFHQSDPLDKVWARCDQYFDFARWITGDYTETFEGQKVLLLRQHILCLRGETNVSGELADENFDEAAFVARLKADLDFYQYYATKVEVQYLFGQYEAALETAQKFDKVVDAGRLVGDLRVAIHYFYYTLVLTALYPTATPEEQKQSRKILKKNQKKMKKWAEKCPPNHKHRYLLTEAGIARISGDSAKAMRLYDQALSSAHEHGFTKDEALINEIMGRFYLGQGQEKIAKSYLLDARQNYLTWGASGKVDVLVETYPQLLTAATAVSSDISPMSTTITTSGSGSSLDLTTVVKASQVISGEIVLQQLLEKLMKIVIANAGAETGYLILNQGDRWVIEAEGAVNQSEVTTLQSIPIEEGHVSLAIVNYVTRTQQSVVLDDATRQGEFTQDEYVLAQEPKSLLCTPLINQGKLSGIVYLENNLTTGAFTPDRIEVLNVLSSQAAISIENATLYNTLEEKVVERTAQLAEANDEITALNERLKEENLRLEAELDVARQLQQLLLPKDEELKQIGGLDIAGFMEPAEEVGGDYYDVLQHNGRVKIGIGDVTDHGLESGVVMLMTQMGVRTLLLSNEKDPVRFMDILNQAIYANGLRMQSQRSLTLALLEYIPPEDDGPAELKVSGQHEEIIVVRKDGSVELVDTADLGFPIGIDDEISDFIGETSINLEKGDGVVLYTDGFTEAENINREFYGLERLCQIVGSSWSLSAEGVREAIVNDVRAFIGDQVIYDDLTLVVVKQA